MKRFIQYENYKELIRVSESKLLHFLIYIINMSYRLTHFAKWANKPENKNRISEYKIVPKNYCSRRDYKDRMKKIAMSLKKEIIKKYIKKFGNSLDDIINKAKSGDKRALFKLIKFDKAWLFIDWVKEIILGKEWDDDKAFFDGFSDAVRHKRKSRNRNKTKVEQEIYQRIDLFSLLRHWFGKQSDFYQIVYDFFYFSVVEDNILNLNDNEQKILNGIHILNDKKYFIKYLTRHATQ